MARTYKLASSSKRLTCRLLEVIILNLISILTFYLLTFWNITNDVILNEPLFTGMMVVNTCLTFIIWNIYFIFLPIIYRQQTLLSIVFKIKIHCLNKKQKTSAILKKEALMWYPIFVVLILFNVSLFAVNDLIFFLKNFIVMTDKKLPLNDKIIATVFKVAFVAVILPICMICINTIWKSNKKTFIDNVSLTRMIDLSVINTRIIHHKKSQDELPGIINNIEELEI